MRTFNSMLEIMKKYEENYFKPEQTSKKSNKSSKCNTKLLPVSLMYLRTDSIQLLMSCCSTMDKYLSHIREQVMQVWLLLRRSTHLLWVIFGHHSEQLRISSFVSTGLIKNHVSLPLGVRTWNSEHPKYGAFVFPNYFRVSV